MSDKLIEEIYANRYNTSTTSRKDIGDIYVDNIPINIKSSRVGGNNYSPNLVSADKLYNYLIDEKNILKFLFRRNNCLCRTYKLGLFRYKVSR